MPMTMNSFPKFLRSEPSPRVQDSAFPPFKIEHRYRGVYERAGFDVNLGNSTDNKSIHSKTSSRRNPPLRYPSPPKSSSNSPLSEVSQNSDNKHIYNSSNNSSLSFPTKNIGAKFYNLNNYRQPEYISPTGSNRSLNNRSESALGSNNSINNRSAKGQINPLGDYTHSDSKGSNNSLGNFNQPPNNSSGGSIQAPSNSYNNDYRQEYPSDIATDNYRHEYSSDIATNGYRPDEYENPYATPTHGSFSNQPMNYQEKLPMSAYSNLSFGKVDGYRGSVSEAKSVSHSRTNTINAISGYPTSLRAISSTGSNSDALSQEPEISTSQPKIAQHQQVRFPSSSEENFIFSPSSTNRKNFKNLQLDLDNDRTNNTSDSEAENENYAESSKYDSSNDTKNTSIDRLEDQEGYNQIEQKQFGQNVDQDTYQKKRFSDTFDELNRGAESHKKHNVNPSTTGVSPPTIASTKENSSHFGPQPEIPYPVNDRFSYSPVNTSTIDPSSQFRSFQKQTQNNDQNLNLEYQNFLNGTQTNKNARKSQLSMVSSILSKGSIYDDDDEDDEVERELQRQLDTLKMSGSGSKLNIAGSVSSSVNDTYSTAATVPVFNIENADETDAQLENPYEKPELSVVIPTIFTTSPQSSHGDLTVTQDSVGHETKQSISESENAAYFNDMSSTASFDSVKPLVVKNTENNSDDSKFSPVRRTQNPKEQAYRGFVSPPALRTVKFDNFVQRNSPNAPVEFDSSSPDSLEFPVSENLDFEAEYVQPLSPKNHEVEEELKGMNFNIDLNPGYPTNSPIQRAMETPEVPSRATMDALEFSPVRPLVLNHQQEEHIYSSGEGPCRSCKLNISPNGKGSQRSIYSKTGELSGQWHRSCFTCNHSDCEIQFSKHVQCYAYKDKPYCHQHYHLLNSTICEHCSLGIEGECIENELEQKWHLNCLRCCKCSRTIQDDYFLINNSIFFEYDADNIISGNESFNDSRGGVIQGGLSTQDRIEKRRTRLLFVD